MSGSGLPDVFSEEFRQAIDQRAREICLPVKDDPNLIGCHYTQNPPWHSRTSSFDTWIDEIVQPGTAAIGEWIRLMRKIYGSIERWRESYGYPIKSRDEMATKSENLRSFIYLAGTGSGIYTGEPAKFTYTASGIDEFEEVYRGMITMGIEHP